MKKIMPKDEDCRDYLGRHISITKGAETHTGEVIACGCSAMAVAPNRIGLSWTIRVHENDTLDFLPSDGWRISHSD